MPRPFDTLRGRLLDAGIAPRHIRRYLAELSEHLADLTAEETRAGRDPASAEDAALTRLGDTDLLARAMIRRAEFRSWSARAPWAVFLVAPPLALAGIGAVTIALLVAVVEFYRPEPGAHAILPAWFGPVALLATRFDLLVVPVLLGWGVALTAARQRTKLFWPAIGLAVIALLGGMAEFEVALPTAPGGPGEISLGFALAPPFDGLVPGLVRGAAMLALTLVPYLSWRILRARAEGAG